MNHQARGLFDDNQIIVFVDDLEGDVLRLEAGAARQLQIHFNNLVATQPVARLFLAVPDTDRPCPVQCLNMRSSALDKVAGQEYIQP